MSSNAGGGVSPGNFRSLRPAVVAGLALVLFPLLSYAQISLPGARDTLVLSSFPPSAGPGESVTMTAQDPYLDAPSTLFTWYVNNVAVASSTGLASYSVRLGALGSQTDVAVTADGPGGELSARATLIPTSIDLLWESDSYTPPFYRGRALPTPGTALRLLAVPHFVGEDGKELPASSLLYTWKSNGITLRASSGVGKSSALIPISPFSLSQAIEVDVTSSDGVYAGSAGSSIAIGQPILMLYQDHPLFGILYDAPILSRSVVSETEMAFAAVPYFAPASSVNDAALTYAWQVNNQPVVADPKQPSEIGINAQNSSGVASLLLGLSKPSDILLDISGAWNILFSGAASRSFGTSSPFTAPAQ